MTRDIVHHLGFSMMRDANGASGTFELQVLRLGDLGNIGINPDRNWKGADNVVVKIGDIRR